MCSLDQITAQLLSRYEASLEKQIAGGGSSLVCQDEQLCGEVEAMLEDGDARYTHSLGLDPLRIMEESLKATQDPAFAGSKARGGLKGLAKAFEVMEQAGLNLYLSPWRAEYKVVKMYSGVVTHYIKPALSTPQILRLFGLLGYQPSPASMEQLQREPAAVGFADQDRLLRLSCAFFLVRCECRLLLAALGRYAGDTDWELGLVCERQRGHCVQVSLDNVRKTLEVEHFPKGNLVISGLDGEQDLDLYTAAEVSSGKTEVAPDDDDDDEGPRSLSWGLYNTASPTVSGKPPSNGVTPPSSLSAAQPGKPVCVTTLLHQVTAPPPGFSSVGGFSSAGGSTATATAQQPGRPHRESATPQTDPRLSHCVTQPTGASLPPGSAFFCSCVQHNGARRQPCLGCSSVHSMTSEFPQKCQASDGSPAALDKLTMDAVGETLGRRAYGPREGGRSETPAERGKTSVAVAAPDRSDNPNVMSKMQPQPISYHDCCDPAHPDPHCICHSCRVFHTRSCKGLKYCQEFIHTIEELQICCSCGTYCLRRPLVLCSYCGREYCIRCWYQSPVTCACGQTFDQSSAV